MPQADENNSTIHVDDDESFPLSEIDGLTLRRLEPFLDKIAVPKRERYADLLVGLIRAQSARNAGDQGAAPCLRALVAILQFLDADLIVADLGITEVLGALANALNDILQGAQPELLSADRYAGPDEDESKGKRGRPTDRARYAGRGVVAFCASLLIEAGFTRTDAGKIIAREAEHLGIDWQRDDRITPKRVLRWRAEIGAGGPALADEMYETLKAKQKAQPLIANKSEAIALIRHYLSGMLKTAL
ncbi:MAG: hypothetical protein JO110_07830 [Acetobacteraceae bacterium]|nr:hypothetical protein [Acetobacteraceae bacterium]